MNPQKIVARRVCGSGPPSFLLSFLLLHMRWFVVLLCLSLATAQDLTTCNRSRNETAWSYSGVGETPCRMWYQLEAICYPGWVLPMLDPSGPEYLVPDGNDACACSVLAYNLMAACSWCLYDNFNTHWHTETAWFQHCGAYGKPIKPDVDLGRAFPGWALAPNDGEKWNPARAQRIAVPQKPEATSSSTHIHTSPTPTNTLSEPFVSTTSTPTATSASDIETATQDSTEDGDSTTRTRDPPSPTRESTASSSIIESATTALASTDPKSKVPLVPVAVGGAVGGLVVLLLVSMVWWIRRRRKRLARITPMRLAAISAPIQGSTPSLEVAHLLSVSTHTRVEDAQDPPPVYSPASGLPVHKVKAVWF